MKGSWRQRSRLWRTTGTLLSTSKIIFCRCQRQLQISHEQPEVFIQECRNFGFDQKPQIGVNISLVSFTIFTLCMDPPSLMITKYSEGICSSHPHLSLQVEKQLQGRESDQQKSIPNQRGWTLCASRPSLSLFWIRVSPHCLQIMYISSYSLRKNSFSVFHGATWGGGGGQGGSISSKPQIIWKPSKLQAEFEISENNLFGNSKSQIGHLAKVTCPSVQRLQLMGHIVLCSQTTEAASCWGTRMLCGLPV